ELSGADLHAFLRDLRMTLIVSDRTRGDRTRVLQLINKTNQFNLNGRRLTDDDVAAILGRGGRLLGLTLDDRTGTHGEILACLMDGDATIVALVMSCRVFQRRVEYAFLAWLAGLADAPRAMAYAPTPRNGPFTTFLEEVTGTRAEEGFVRFDPAAI